MYKIFTITTSHYIILLSKNKLTVKQSITHRILGNEYVVTVPLFTPSKYTKTLVGTIPTIQKY